MSGNGYILLHRSMLDSGLWRMPDSYIRMFLYIALQANWQDGKWWADGEMLVVKRGSFVTSARKLADQLNITRASVRRALLALERNGTITVSAAHRGTLITVVNFDKYNDPTWAGGPSAIPSAIPSADPSVVPNRRREEGKKNTRGSKKADPRIGEFKTWWCEKYFARYGVRHSWTGKEASQTKKLLGMAGSLEELQARAERMLESQDHEFPPGPKHLGVLLQHYNKWVPRARQKSGQWDMYN